MWKNSLKILNPLLGIRRDDDNDAHTKAKNTQTDLPKLGASTGLRTCDVCATRTDSLRRGRCAPCYMRWSQHRPVGLGAECVVCSDRRCEFLQSVEFQQKWLPMCHNCSGRVARLDPMPQRLDVVRELLKRDRRDDDRRAGAADPRLIPLNRRGKSRRTMLTKTMSDRAVMGRTDWKESIRDKADADSLGRGRESNDNLKAPMHLQIDPRRRSNMSSEGQPVLLTNGRHADTLDVSDVFRGRFEKSNDLSVNVGTAIEDEPSSVVEDVLCTAEDGSRERTVRAGVGYREQKTQRKLARKKDENGIGIDWVDLLFQPDSSDEDGKTAEENTSMTMIHRPKRTRSKTDDASRQSSDTHAAV